MLVIDPLLHRHRRDDDGAVLVTVVVVMFVGFVIATVIAGSVLFTIQANADNKGRTQAFISAESGRDAAVADIKSKTDPATGVDCSTVVLSSGEVAFGAAGSTYSYSIYPASGPPDYVPGATPACPTVEEYLVIRSTGTAPDGSTSTIESAYRWSSLPSDVPGGVVTYFSGTTTQGVSHYTGDLVLRNGNWSCNIDGVLDGDLYVLSGTVSISQGCTINGDIYAKGAVSSNSQNWHVNPRVVGGVTVSAGNITSDGFVSFAANGNPSVAGAIHARGNVTLAAGGGGTGTIGGTVTSMAAATVDPAWTIVGTPVSGSATPPPFVPSLAWLADASKWIDLDSTSGWGAKTVPSSCKDVLKNEATATAYVTPLLSADTTPLVLDFTSCPDAVALNLAGAATITRDVAVLVAENKSMTIKLGAGVAASAAHQILFVHEDADRDDRDVNGDPKPTCGIGGQDAFDTTGLVDSDIRVMIYSPCGLGGTVTAAFGGQLYTDDTTHFHSNSNYACLPMSWPPALPNLSCTIKGSGGVIEETTTVQTLGDLVYQTER